MSVTCREFLQVSWRETEETGTGLGKMDGKGRVFLPEVMARGTQGTEDPAEGRDHHFVVGRSTDLS